MIDIYGEVRKTSQLLGAAFVGALVIAGVLYFNILFVAAGVFVALFAGRYFCGWFCPMGAFAERIMGLIFRRRQIPAILTRRWLAYFFAAAFLLTLVLVRQNFGPPVLLQ